MDLGSVLEIKSVMFMHPDTVSYVMMLWMTVCLHHVFMI